MLHHQHGSIRRSATLDEDLRKLLDALDGKRPPRIVNPDVWPVYVKRFEKTFGFRPE